MTASPAGTPVSSPQMRGQKRYTLVHALTFRPPVDLQQLRRAATTRAALTRITERAPR